MTGRLMFMFVSFIVAVKFGMTAPHESPLHESPTSTFKNPLNRAGADPWAAYYEGFYYFTRTAGNGVDIWKSRTLTGVDHGEQKRIYNQENGLKDIWAPEIHHLQGKWYVYFTANTGCGDQCRGIYVLENSAADPLSGAWLAKGRINTGPGLDGTVFQHNGKMFFAYGGYDEFWSSLYLAQMSNPWTLSSKPVRIAYRDQSWESDLLEGPEVLIRNGKVFIAYSTFPCWSDNYRLGLLSASATADLLNPASWIKSAGPVFQGANGVYASGHNGFTKSKDGTQDWMIYHGNSKAGEGCGARPSRAQQLTWDMIGRPAFGQPSAETTALAVPAGEYTIEAEHTVVQNAAITMQVGASNGRVVSKMTQPDSSVLFHHINVPATGIYEVRVRYANTSRTNASRRISTHRLEINGKPAGLLNYQSTRGRSKNTEVSGYGTVTFRATFERGYKNSLMFTKGTGAVEIDKVDLVWFAPLPTGPSTTSGP